MADLIAPRPIGITVLMSRWGGFQAAPRTVTEVGSTPLRLR
jgi:hypothetical protein